MSHLLDALLDHARREDIERHERAEQARIIRGEPYLWPMVPWRTDKPSRRRDEPRASRWGNLHG